jgi:predicted MFS family arabinose efflux permease
MLSYPPESLVRGSGLLLIGAGIAISLSSSRMGTGERSGLRRAVARTLNPLVLWVILAAFSLGFLSGVLREYFYLYVHEAYGLEREGLGNLLLAAGIASVLAGLAVGMLSDRRGIHGVLLAVVLASALSSLALGASMIGLAGVAVAYVVASSGVRASLPLTRNAALVGRRGGSFMVGASNTSSSLGMMTGPLLAGILYESSGGRGNIPFLITGLLLLLTAATYTYIRSRHASFGNH